MKACYKRVVSITLLITIICGMLPVVKYPVMAVTTTDFESCTVLNLGLSATDATGSGKVDSKLYYPDCSWTADGTQLSGSLSGAKHRGTSKKMKYWKASETTLTMKNELDSVATLSFDYDVTTNGEGHATGDYDSVIIVGTKETFTYTATEAGLHFEEELRAGESISITLKVAERMEIIDSDKKWPEINGAAITITNLQLSAAKMVTVQFAAAENGVYSVIDPAGAPVDLTQPLMAYADKKYKLTAEPAENYSFAGWYATIQGVETFLSASSSYTTSFTEDCTIAPKFMLTEDAVWAVGSAVFADLSSALAEAEIGSVKTVVLLKDYVLTGAYTIPSGVTLLIPFDDAFTSYGANPATETIPDGCTAANSAYRKLTMSEGSQIYVAGKLELAAKHYASQAGHALGGMPVSAYGQIEMGGHSAIVIQEGGYLYAWGSITGTGTVTAESGATICEKMQITDYWGESRTADLVAASIFPFRGYSVQNVEVMEIVKAGAALVCHAGFYDGGMQTSVINLIGGENAVFAISSGAVSKYYDIVEDRLAVEFEGMICVNSVSFLGWDLSGCILPISKNVAFRVTSGSTVTVNRDLLLLPGAEIHVDADGTLCIASDENMYLTDASDWSDGTDDAKLDVNGSFVLYGNLYTSASGAKIISTGKTGFITMHTGAPATAVIPWSEGSGGSNLQTYDIAVQAALLTNGAQDADGNPTTVSTEECAAGTVFYYCATCDIWYTGSHICPATVTVTWMIGETYTTEDVVYTGQLTVVPNLGGCQKIGAPESGVISIYDSNGLCVLCDNQKIAYTFTDGKIVILSEVITGPITIKVNIVDDHTGRLVYTNHGDGTHSAAYDCCGASFADHEPHTYEPVTHQCACMDMETFTVQFRFTGIGTLPVGYPADDSRVMEYGSVLDLNALLEQVSEPDRYGFSWHIGREDGERITQNSYTVTGEVTLVCVSIPDTWNVTWELENALGFAQNMVAYYKTNYTAVFAPADHYYLDETCFAITIGDTVSTDFTVVIGQNEQATVSIPAEDILADIRITVTAKPVMCLVSWLVDGQAYASVHVPYGSSITKPTEDPEKVGYSFSGWEGYSDGLTVTAETHAFTALWTKNLYSITFADANGTVLLTVRVPYGDVPEFSGEYPAKSPDETGHYSFLGWSDGENVHQILPAVTDQATYTAAYVTAPHSDLDQNYRCDVCGYVTGSCGHDTLTYSDSSDGTHRVQCNRCGDTVYASVPHAYDGEGLCICGNAARAAITDSGGAAAFYCTLRDAVAAATADGVVILCKDIVLTEVLTVSTDQVWNFGGYSLRIDSASGGLLVEARLTITGGIFSVNVTEYLADGYCLKLENTFFRVVAHTEGTAVTENEVTPTCLLGGGYDTVIYCTNCGSELYRETTTFQANGHSEASREENRVEPTCGVAGAYDAVTYCTVCSIVLDRQVISLDATGDHSYAAGNYIWTEDFSGCSVTGTCGCGASLTVVAMVTSQQTASPTCDEVGETVYTATFAEPWVEEQRKVVEIPATGHSFGAVHYLWEPDYSACIAKRYCDCGAKETATATVTSQTTDAACQTDGRIVYIATFQKDWTQTQTKEKTIPAPGHKPLDPVKENQIAPTCAVDGSYESVVYCGVCTAEIARQTCIVPATGEHSYTILLEDKTVPATCVETGIKVFKCQNCDATQDETLPLDPNHHTDSSTTGVNAKVPTCTENGYSGDTVCACGTVLIRGHSIPASGHLDENTDHLCDHGCGEIVSDCGDQNGDADHNCDLCGKAAITPCTGGTATCQNAAQCQECGNAYGQPDSQNHASDGVCWEDNGDGTHTYSHHCCGALIATESHTYTDGVCTCGNIRNYTVTLMNGTELWQTCIVAHGESLALTAVGIPVREGYTFCGWVYADGTMAEDRIDAITSDLTIYADWMRNTDIYYVITWNILGQNFTQQAAYTTVPVYALEAVLAKAADAEDHYTFAGWSASEGGPVLEILPVVTGDTTYYAVFTAEAHTDTETPDHHCDRCGIRVSQCVDLHPSDHSCDICMEILTQCEDADEDRYCDCCAAHLLQRGDLDDDGDVDSDDAVYLANYLQEPQHYPLNQSGDLNGDGEVDYDDVVYLMFFTHYPQAYPLYP